MSEAVESKGTATVLPAHFDAGSAADYVSLMKPRVMSLVIFTAGIGLFMAPGSVHPVLAFSALLMIALGAGGSAALNMWYDADIDRQMSRTQNRAIPAGKITSEAALGYGLWISGFSVLALGVLINYTSAALLAFTIFFYAVIYTMWLKRLTPQNIVIGGAAGALPPVVGWAVASPVMTLEPWLYFAIIFMWTPPHFWALALLKQEEYGSVQVPMLPVTHGIASTKRQIVIYSVALVAVSLSPVYFGFAGQIYFASMVVLNSIFLALAVWLALDASRMRRLATSLFTYSIAYLFILFALLPIDRSWGG